jgi:hypothetical protein
MRQAEKTQELVNSNIQKDIEDDPSFFDDDYSL